MSRKSGCSYFRNRRVEHLESSIHCERPAHCDCRLTSPCSPCLRGENRPYCKLESGPDAEAALTLLRIQAKLPLYSHLAATECGSVPWDGVFDTLRNIWSFASPSAWCRRFHRQS